MTNENQKSEANNPDGTVGVGSGDFHEKAVMSKNIST
jgi:hypothetical protein